MSKKEARQVLRERRATQSQKMREALRTGDERYLPPRDQGPAKRFIRTYVDSRFCFAEVLLPLLLLVMLLQASGNPRVMQLSNAVWMAVLLLTLGDSVWVIFRMRRALRAKLPGEDLRGTTFYALTRMMQLRWLRLPKRQVGLGGKPIVRKPKS